MQLSREPLLKPVPVRTLRPTQITVGLREVGEMQRRWRSRPQKKDIKFLERHLVPVVLGPRGDHYVLDHHHLCRALLHEGVREVLVTIVADLGRLKKDAFWIYLDNHGWLHPYDEKGRRRPYADIPRELSDMVDDPFRSLAGAIRRAGGFAKDTTAFSEFLWADFFRRKIKRKKLEHDFDAVVKKAFVLAKSKDADYLPGWCGPS
jgi:hypothetical protein